MPRSTVNAERTRANVMAGLFYPDDAAEQRSSLEALGLGAAEGTARLVIAPHASWDYSGRTAAAALNAAPKSGIERIVLVGPVHFRCDEGLYLSESASFQTALGNFRVDQAFCQELESCGTSFSFNDIPHLEEHALEVLLPMLKSRYPDASLIPILTSGSRPSLAKALSRALDLVFSPLTDSTLFVVSTNLSNHSEALQKDEQAETFLALLAKRDHEGIFRALDEASISACGALACAGVLGARMFDGLKGHILQRNMARPSVTGLLFTEGGRELQYAALAYHI